MGDAALQALTQVLVVAGTMLPLVRDQVQLEFIQNATERDAILRGNCVATRLMSSYCNLIGMPWVRKSLKGAVKLLLDEELWVFDRSKINGTPEEKVRRVVINF
jgi:hypothetical protein